MGRHIRIILCSVLLFMTSPRALAQGSDKDAYPATYSIAQAAVFESKGAYEKAIWYYINLFPENRDTVIARVKAIARQSDTTDIRRLIKKSFVLYATFDPAITSFEKGAPDIDMAKMRQKGAWGDALILAVTESADLTAVDYNRRGLFKAKSGKFQEAIADFDKSIRLQPSGEVYCNRAYTKSMIKDFKGAIKDYDSTIAMQYKVENAYFERGYCKDESGEDPEGAIADYTNAIAINARYADAYNNRAFVQLKAKKYEEAIRDFDEAIKINPEYAGAYVNRGYAKKELNDKKGACADWKAAVKLGTKEAQAFVKEYCK